MIGLASTAPVYSLVATLGWVVMAVGAQAPIAFIIAFIPMLFIAAAYQELNREIPDCGTTFTWATKAFGPRVGWMGGWGVAVAGIVVLANLAQIGGIYFWLMFGQDELAESTFVVTATGVVFIALMCWVSYRGLEIGERLQVVLLEPAVPGSGPVRGLRHLPDRHGDRRRPRTTSPGSGSTRSRSPTTPASSRPCCWPCSSTGAGTPASR